MVLSLPAVPIRLAPSEIWGLMEAIPLMRTSSLIALLASAVFATAAEDGAQIYNSLCGACHGPDGKGLNGLPPLVGSEWPKGCLLYTSPSPRDRQKSRMPSSA